MSCTNSESVTELKPNVKRIEDKGDCIPVQSQVIQGVPNVYFSI